MKIYELHHIIETPFGLSRFRHCGLTLKQANAELRRAERMRDQNPQDKRQFEIVEVQS